MDLSLSSDQVLVRNVARDFVKGQAPKEMLVNLDKQGMSFPQDVWNQAAAMGWLGSLIPTDYGGEGNSVLDTAIIFEELGRGPVPGPFFESGVLSALTILEGGDETQKRDLLPTIASGQRIFVTAIMDPAPRWGPEGVKMQAESRNGDYVLNGAKAFVHHAAHADSFLVAARIGGADAPITLFVVDKSMAGVDTEDFNNGTMTGFGAVNLNNVKVPGSAVLGQVGQGWNILERAMVRALPVLSAYHVGGLETVAEYAITYSQSRIVFAQPIGRFQRVQDRILDVVNHRDASRWMTWEAIWKMETGREHTSSVYLAKAAASLGYYEGTNLSTEVHAGIGIEPGTGLNIHIKMSRGLYSYLGDPRYYRRRMVDAMY